MYSANKRQNKEAELMDLIRIMQSKYIGISVDEYAHEKGFSKIVSRIKLDEFYKQGKICQDASVEGVKYYQNDIINVRFE